MQTITKEKELKIITENKEGILAEISGLIAEKGINIENICAYTLEDKCIFHIITNNNEMVRTILLDKGYHITEKYVIVLVLWNRPGSLSEVTRLFKEHGLKLEYVYGTSSTGGERLSMVLSAYDEQKALEIFEEMLIKESME